MEEEYIRMNVSRLEGALGVNDIREVVGEVNKLIADKHANESFIDRVKILTNLPEAGI